MTIRTLAFVFPGQAAQCIGMGQAMADEFDEARDVFETANEAVGFDLAKLCFEGPKEQLDLTENTQPAVLTASCAVLAVIKERTDVAPYLVAGHSLGEYTAAVCVGCLEFRDAVMLVRRRAQLMQEAVPVGEGGMVAVIGSDRETIESVCDELQGSGVITAANINCPGQIVISGEMALLDEAMEMLREKGARKLVKLPLSAPFHSQLMAPAAEKFSLELDRIPFKRANMQIISNSIAMPVEERDDVVNALKLQMTSPVLWEDCVNKMLEMGVTDFVEVGPQKIISSFIKRISRDANVSNVDGPESFRNFSGAFGS
ncbi:MAG: ACP S-malonyltransferase [Candidatus Coatesbacteria bacterium]|nr:ACP S-malonyltransferase [Candidatus Coatesbacteria bacterium]